MNRSSVRFRQAARQKAAPDQGRSSDGGAPLIVSGLSSGLICLPQSARPIWRGAPCQRRRHVRVHPLGWMPHSDLQRWTGFGDLRTVDSACASRPNQSAKPPDETFLHVFKGAATRRRAARPASAAGVRPSGPTRHAPVRRGPMLRCSSRRVHSSRPRRHQLSFRLGGQALDMQRTLYRLPT
jgi:hypothetical protein